ncbi:uncharacterized protein LOC134229289 [Saccostrea cucullata]|uniref:uncharacterized protein LOC134229289 n=1 Tax=Saccostrea cuccullata TaxID=36930 RepID=UPI002ED5927B
MNLTGRSRGRDNFERSEEKSNGPSDKTLTFFDFGGQCAYYACHQIYLTRRAFYIVVVDASKDLNQVVDKEVCDQTDTVFSGWTYKEYFVFWLKSIHTYCSTVKHGSDDQVEVLIVATHWDKSLYKNKDFLLQSLYNELPNDSDTNQYIREDRCFLARFPAAQPLVDLEKCIIDITLSARWSEKIPHEWVFLNDEINEESKNQPILSFNDLHGRLPVEKDAKTENAVDMLRYYHDAGKCLFFNEEDLQESVIIDVQWFINAFKTIITDKLHVKGIHASKIDWKEYYETGNLKDTLLDGIWELEDKNSQVLEKNDEIKRNGGHYLDYKTTLLNYMMRLGLIAVGKECHYVPSMNKKKFDIAQKEFIQNTESKTSVLVFQFDFLPFFLFYRLVVTLMQIEGLEVLRSKGTTCLYKNTAMYNYRDHYLVVAVTCNSIQFQILHSEADGCLQKEITVAIRQCIDEILMDITNTFHKHLSYTTGFTCLEKNNQIIGIEIDDNFIEEKKLRTGTSMNCPLHQLDDRHKINPDYLTEFWK